MKRNLFTISLVLLIAVIFVVASCSKSTDNGEKAVGIKEKDETNTDANKGVKTDDAELMIVKTCPVMGGEAILDGKFIVHDGYKVYFCCPSCDDAFEKDPETYIAKIKADPEKYIKDFKN